MLIKKNSHGYFIQPFKSLPATRLTILHHVGYGPNGSRVQLEIYHPLMDAGDCRDIAAAFIKAAEIIEKLDKGEAVEV